MFERFLVPKNNFDHDPFAENISRYFEAMSDQTGQPLDVCMAVYRIVPESFLALTVARAAIRYIELIEQGVEVALYTSDSSTHVSQKSIDVMTGATKVVLDKLGYNNVAIKNFPELKNFFGVLQIVEDIMYTGDQLVTTVSACFSQNQQLKKIVVAVAASPDSALESLQKKKNVELSVLSIIPNPEEIVTHDQAASLYQFFGRKKCFVITAHKLPDTFSLVSNARALYNYERGIVQLYPEKQLRKYPSAQDLGEKAYKLFW